MNRGSGSCLTWVLCLLAFVSVAINASTARAADTLIQAPCDDSGKNGLRTCAHFLDGGDPDVMSTGGGTPIDDPGLLKLLRERFAKQIRALYGIYADAPPTPLPAGYVVDFNKPHALGVHWDTDNPPGTAFNIFGSNVCNIVGIGEDSTSPSPVYIKQEYETNSLSVANPQLKGCGTPMTFTVNPNLHAAIHQSVSNSNPAPACACLEADGSPKSQGPDKWQVSPSTNCGTEDAPIPPSCSPPDEAKHGPWYTCLDGVSPTATINSTPPGSGPRENAYLQGAYGSALACFYNAKVNQLASIAKVGGSKNLTIEAISYGGAEPSASQCVSTANALKFLTISTSEKFAGLIATLDKNGLAGSGEFADIVHCKSTWDNDSPTLNNPLVSSLRQQAQHLCAMRADLEEAFYRLAECQIFALAQAAWNNVIMDHLNAYFADQIMVKVGSPCANYCKDFMSRKPMFDVKPGFSSGKDLKTPSKFEAAFNAAKCAVCGLPLVPCHPHDVGSWCDMSGSCPVGSPYAGENTSQSFATQAEAAQEVPPKTKAGTQADITQCTNSCYQYGVLDGVIQAPAPLDKTPTQQKKFKAPADSVYAKAKIPSYQQVIHDYLQAQWPRKSSVTLQDCALAKPKAVPSQ